MIRMKSLSSFRGAAEGKVRRGREFLVGNDRRAKELEDAGLAFRLDAPTPAAGQIKAPVNEAAVAGPLGSAGGETGAAEPAPLSPPAQARRPRRSKASATDLL